MWLSSNDGALKPCQREDMQRLLERSSMSRWHLSRRAEAARIALEDGADGVAQLRDHVEALEITNICVVRKNGVLTGKVFEILVSKPKAIVDRVITSVALAGWAVFEPDRAPSPEYLKSFDPLVDELVREPDDCGAGAAQNITWRRSWLAWSSPTRTNWTALSLMVPLGGTLMKMLSSRLPVTWKSSSRTCREPRAILGLGTITGVHCWRRGRGGQTHP
ncbi:hypothetical protein ACFSLT_31515 [Novosphingobium resinovorum]